MTELKFYFLIVLAVIISAVCSLWLGFYPIAILIGVFSIIIGFKVFEEAQLNFRLLLLLSIQILFLCFAFTFVFFEFNISFIDAITISFQNLFHVSIITIPDTMESLNMYKLIASFESFIGYILIVSGVSLMIKNKGIGTTTQV